MFSLAMTLMRKMSGSRSFRGMGHVFVEGPVDVKPDAELLLVGLDVDVGGAPLERVHEQHVRELDDGAGVGRRGEVAEVDLVVIGLERFLASSSASPIEVEVDLGEAADGGHVVDAGRRRAARDLLAGRPRPARDSVAARGGRRVALVSSC